MSRFGNSVLVVPPFECLWLADEELRFPEAGRGRISLEVCAGNDVTVVLKEAAGSRHYRTDPGPNYTIVFGSHRNRRLKIEVDGLAVADVEGIAVSPSRFERFWISVYDGVITVGKGEIDKGAPILQWVDSKPDRKVQYIGLSSWDKHVGYRNIKVLPYVKGKVPMLASAQYNNTVTSMDGFPQFHENPVFSDALFVVGSDLKSVPAHRVVLASCSTGFSPLLLEAGNTIKLPSVEYSTLHSLLQYLYCGRTQVKYSQLVPLQELSKDFGLDALSAQCEQLYQVALWNGIISKDDLSSATTTATVELVNQVAVDSLENLPDLPYNVPVKVSTLKGLFETGEYTDVEISLHDHGKVICAHKLILSSWSSTFAKMFTNGMCESNMTRINIKDVNLDAFMTMLYFMYSGRIELDKESDAGSSLLLLLLLADQFSVDLLQKECIAQLLECISENSVYALLQVVSCIQNCEDLRDACDEYVAKNFDLCSAKVAELKEMETETLRRILQNPNLRVAPEEKVLNTIIGWASEIDSIHDWIEASHYLQEHSVCDLFGERMEDLTYLLPLVRFILIPFTTLQKLEFSCICKDVPMLGDLVKESLDYADPSRKTACQEDVSQTLDVKNQGRFIYFLKNSLMLGHRPSSFKELLYICDGDQNGVLYHAGTSYGAHPWMNPVLLKTVHLSASSPTSRYTDGKALASRVYQGTSFAGPCIDEGKYSTWWRIDLGEKHQLICNYYTIRQDGSVNFLRHWSLQGSSDGKQWTDLKVHQNDHTISRVAQFSSWPVHGAHALTPFRFFQICLTGPSTCNTNPWNLCLCYIELYGHFL